jgi:hypothetical protein
MSQVNASGGMGLYRLPLKRIHPLASHPAAGLDAFGLTELCADIQAWINAPNADREPFIWTKTADEILETLAAYCQRINDS